MSKMVSVLTTAMVVISCGVGGQLLGTPATQQISIAEPMMVAEPEAQSPAATPASTATPAQTAPATTTVPQAAVLSTNAVAAQPSSLPIYQEDNTSMDRVERRKIKAMKFAATIDSLVMSRSFVFLPNSMQEIPGGWLQMIYNQFYYVGVMKDHVEVHLPIIRGNVMPYYEILNFDTFEVQNYQASRAQFGWNVSFNLISKNDVPYTINIMIYTMTGETVMNLLTISNSIRYVGFLRSASETK